MNRYLVKANGRQKGAIGIFHDLQVFVRADDPDKAILRAYEYVEHLTRVQVELESESHLRGSYDLIDGDK